MNYLLFVNGPQLSGPSWFLRVLFWISIATVLGHFILAKFVKNKHIFELLRFLIYFSALFIGYFLHKVNFNIYSIGSMFTCAFLYYIGILYGQNKEKININFIVFICCFVVFLISNHFILYQIHLGPNIYPNPLWLIIVSLIGFVMIFFVSKCLSKLNIIREIFSYIGRHTISILLLHLLAFKLVSFIHVTVNSEPSYYLASFPIIVKNLYWGIAYCFVGVILPLIAAFCWEQIQIKFESIKTKNSQMF